MSIQENIFEIREKIANAAQKSGRKAEDITLIAVTKTIEVPRILEAVNFGVTELGENRVQELIEKHPQIDDVTWHLIGHLQTNKVKYMIDKVKLIHSVDSLKLAAEINSHAKKIGKVQDVLLEVNISGEESKFGIPQNQLLKLAEDVQTLDNIRVCGLMTIPPAYADEYETKKLFEICNNLFIDIKGKRYHNSNMEFLSMGMSGDFEIAIEAGANIVRIGTGIFGKRDYTK